MDDTRPVHTVERIGPIGGPNVLGRATVTPQVQPQSPDAAVIGLVEAVVAANPNYLPGVASGTVSARAWYQRKAPQWAALTHTPAIGREPAGHVAVRLNGMRPDRELVGGRMCWELGMLMVRPGVRGCGLAKNLVEVAGGSFRGPLWASVHSDSPGHRLLLALGWFEFERFYWDNDPVEGLVMVTPTI